MGLPIPTVTITVVDNGANVGATVPQTSVQVKIGCAIGGVVNQPFATLQPSALQTQFIGGTLVEAAALVCEAGNVAVCISAPIVTLGTATAVQSTVPGGSTSVVTTSLDATHGAWDTYYFQVKCVLTGTIGTGPGPSVIVSRDGGRNFGAPISLGATNALYLGAGTLTTFLAGGSGVQLNFAAGTLVNGDSWRFSTIAPLWNDAGLNAALAAFFSSQYAVSGVGSMHIVGTSSTGDITAIQTAVQAGATSFVYERVMVELRDALTPTTYGGAGETEATWIAALATVTSSLTAQVRVCAGGGHYNTPSPFATPDSGAPSYRRPATWSQAVRRTQIQRQRRAGRVLDNPLSTISVLPQDAQDGFIYHDERSTPGLNASRIMTLMTWPLKGTGFFVCQENLLSPSGSQFTELAIGNVLDDACSISYQIGVDQVSNDVPLAPNGTLDPVFLNTLQADINNELKTLLVNTSEVSAVFATLNPLWNVQTTGTIPITVAVQPKGYVNAITTTIFIQVA